MSKSNKDNPVRATGRCGLYLVCALMCLIGIAITLMVTSCEEPQDASDLKSSASDNTVFTINQQEWFDSVITITVIP